MENYDLLIIGGGPSGIATALEAKKAGLNYVIIEKGALVNSIYQFPTNMTFFSTSLKLEIGNIPFISHNDKPTRKEALEYYRRVVLNENLNYKSFERVISVTNNQDVFNVTTSIQNYVAKNIVVATGFYDTPKKLGIPGENLPKVKHYYADPHLYVGKKIIVIGAANSACDVALETYQKGAEVTMVIRNKEIYPKVKYWIKPNIENRIKEKSIKAYFSSNVTAISQKHVCIKTPEGEIELENDFVLAMTGYIPDFDFLRSLGIKLKNDKVSTPIFNPETLESNIPNLFLAGVILAGKNTSKLFIENTRHHGKLIVEAIQKK